ncbi:MAG: hypothetical protein FWF05_02075 [Oscillospiraceae bacterium]|nr:hypothetical protein [Oscillospiraceae bacterium]
MKCGNCGSIVPDDLAICNVCKKPVISKRADGDVVMCPCCGEEHFKGIELCSKCGTSLAPPKEKPEHAEQSAARQPRKPAAKRGSPHERKPRLNKRFILAVGVLAAIAAGIVLLIVLPRGGEKPDASQSTNAVQSFYSKADGKTSFFYEGKPLGAVDGEARFVSASTGGGKKAVPTADGFLYFVDTSGMKLVDHGGIMAYNIDMPLNGAYIAYLKENAADESTTAASANPPDANGGRSLYIYNTADGTATFVAPNVAGSTICFDPAGKTLAYATILGSDGFECYMYHTADGVYEPVGKNTRIIAMTENASMIYYLKYEGFDDTQVIKLFVKKTGESEVKLGEFAHLPDLCTYFSSDFSELVFSVNGDAGNFFISANGADKKRLSGGFKPVYGVSDPEHDRTAVLPVKTSFAETFYLDAASDLYMINAETLSPALAAQNVSAAKTADSGKTLYYIDGNDSLYRCKAANISGGTKLAGHVRRFAASDDGKRVYYLNSDGELRCLQGGEDFVVSEKIYDTGRDLWVVGSTVYFLEDYSNGSGILYYSADGKAKKAVSGADNVYDVRVDMSGGVYYMSDYSEVSGSYDLFYGKEDVFSQVVTDSEPST